MSFMNAIKTCFSKYFMTKGTADHREFWYWILFWVVGVVAARFIDQQLLPGRGTEIFGRFFTPVTGIFLLTTIIPTITAGVRYLRGLRMSPWWMLLAVVAIVLLIMILF